MPRRRFRDSAYSADWSWPAGACSAVIPGATEVSTLSSTSACSRPARRQRAPDDVSPRQHLPAADRCVRGGPEGDPQRHRWIVGLVDRAADDPDPGAPDSADAQAVSLDAAAPATSARAEGDPDE